MKSLSIFVLGLMVAAQSVYAQPRKNLVSKTVTAHDVEVPAPSTFSPYNSSTIVREGHEFGADLGFGTVDPKFHFGLGLRLEFPVVADNNVLRFGVQSGFYLGPSSPTDWMVPVLATGSFEFNVSGSLQPYIGIGLGAAIFHASTGVSSSTSTDFMFLFKPGVLIGKDEKYYFELPVGTTDGNFTLLPSVGMHF